MSLRSSLFLTFFVWHLLACSIAPSAFAQANATLDLTRAVIVAPANFSGPENKAVQMLIEEIEQRSQVRWTRVNQAPTDNSPVVSLARASNKDGLPREGYQIKTTGNAIAIIGNDARGVLFGAGHLLRTLRLEKNKITLPSPLNLTTAPKYPLRGHQLGYRPKTNSYDGWNVARWEQYIRDLVVWGTNAIELIPPRSDDDADSPHFPLPPMQMMIAMSQLCAEYGIDVWIWYPALDKDYGDAKTVDFALNEWGEVFKKLPRVDAVFVPGGDPGNTPPKLLMNLLEKQTANLQRYHPNAGMWVAPQGFTQAWLDEFLGLVRTDIDPAQRRRERLVIGVLAAVQFTTIVDFMVVMPLGPKLMPALGIDPSQFGLIVSSYTFAAGAAGFVAAAVVDRVARRTAFLTLYAGFLVGTLCCALAPNYHALLAARIVAGAFGGLVGGMAMAIVGDVFPEHRRGRATGALMTGFALATTFGVPAGIELGTRFGWHVPFVALVVVGLPVLPLAAVSLPRLADHLAHPRQHPLRQIVDNFVDPNHLNAFALMAALMIGGFAVIPFLATFLVANVGLDDEQLSLVYVMGGALTLVSSPLIGKLADRYGKLRIYRIIAPVSAAVMVGVTYLPPVPFLAAATLFSLLLVANSGRMIAAMAMITGSVAPARRGGFLSANASVQHISAGLGAWIGSRIIGEAADHRLLHYPIVGWIAGATTLATLYLAGRVRQAEQSPVAAVPLSLAAAAEATCDAGEPAIGA